MTWRRAIDRGPALATRLIVPHRGLLESKTRLAAALPSGERARLVEIMLRRVLRAALDEVDDVVVITPSMALAAIAEPLGARVIEQDGLGLNRALEQARRDAAADGIDLIGIVPGDLPIIGADDLWVLLHPLRSATGIAIAPDAHEVGTNALAMRPITAIPFLFGSTSFALHLAAARKAGLCSTVVRRPGLAFDLDTPADLAHWHHMAPAMASR